MLNRFKQNDTFVCDDLTISPTNTVKHVPKGQTVGRVLCSGAQKIFRVRGDGVELDLAYTTWDNGERDIRTAYRVKGPAALRRLEGGRLRLGIRPVNHNQIDAKNKLWVQLSQARVRKETLNKWSTLHKASWEELDDGAGLDSFETLEQVGALHLGTKEEVLASTDNKRFYLCAIFDEENELFPVVAFVVTRVLPLINEYTVSKENLTADKGKSISLDNFQRRLEQIEFGIGEDRGYTKCTACNEPFAIKYSELTGKYCVECFKEIEFGIIPKITPDVGAGTPFYYSSEDDDPSVHNARRIRENGQKNEDS
jgi:hypothetical protein